MRSLLDINVIIALLDPDHDFHRRAHLWGGSQQQNGWGACPLTEKGGVRIMSHPAYNPQRSLTPKTVTEILRRFAEGTDHEFWPDSVSFLDSTLIDTGKVLGPRQITDLYLLALAAARNGRLITFDESINRAAVQSATAESLLVI